MNGRNVSSSWNTETRTIRGTRRRIKFVGEGYNVNSWNTVSSKFVEQEAEVNSWKMETRRIRGSGRRGKFVEDGEYV